ncbi:hypothetical protein DV738_g2235, partial [Chaetothyriales sp. CBS 135597]
MKIGPSPVSFGRLPALPPEIINGIDGFLNQVADQTERQYSLWACCLLSQAWYSVTVTLLYHEPFLTSRNFDLFVRTICPPVHSATRAIGLERLVVVLDMGRLAYESSNHLTARLLRRTGHSLQAFVSPARTFSRASLVPISKAARLRRLDLSRDHYALSLRELLQSVHHLTHLEFLALPKCLAGLESTSPALEWPPRLNCLHFDGSFPLCWHELVPSFPPSLEVLHFVSIGSPSFATSLLKSTATAPQIRRIVIRDPFDHQLLPIAGFFRAFPSLVRLTMPLSTWQPDELFQTTAPSKLERVYLTGWKDPQHTLPMEILNFAESLPALRRVDLDNQSFRCVDRTGRSVFEGLHKLLIRRDGPKLDSMEIHSVLPEERARDPKGEPLPWAYRYAETSRGVRQADDSGSFGRHRSLRATGSRTPRSRAGTTPVRQKENPAVTEFGRLFAKEQVQDEAPLSSASGPGSGSASESATEPSRTAETAAQATPTECLLYGYAGRSSEWKVISRFERIATPGIICEDYPREDPSLFLASNSPRGFSKRSIVVHRQLAPEALRKSRVYKGGEHWIKVTFDSYAAAERACFYSPVEIDGYLVHCELWTGRGPSADVPILPGDSTNSGSNDIGNNSSTAKIQTLPQSHTWSQQSRALPGRESAIAGFERALQTLPRSHAMPNGQFAQPESINEDDSVTASSATAIDHSQLTAAPTPTTILRSRQFTPGTPIAADSEHMTHIPSVKKVVLRPISDALPKQPSLLEQVMKLPILRWFASDTGGPGDVINAGPKLKDDGTWDAAANSWYWSFWHTVDRWCGTDFCGLKED